ILKTEDALNWKVLHRPSSQTFEPRLHLRTYNVHRSLLTSYLHPRFSSLLSHRQYLQVPLPLSFHFRRHLVDRRPHSRKMDNLRDVIFGKY
ncbi:hypothetical protein X975_10947, partial [Stegodyphus mimosarum]